MVPPFIVTNMIKNVICLLFFFFGVTDIFAQSSKFYEESDGFKWHCIWTDDYQGAKDVLGNDIIPLYKYRYVSYSSENGVFQIVINEDDLQNGKFGYCTRSSKIIINPEHFDKSCLLETDGTKYIRVSKQGKCGAYNLDGKNIVPCEYDDCSLYSIDVRSPRRGHIKFFYVKKKGKEGVYDLNGKLVIPVNYKEIRFNNWDDSFKFEVKLDNDLVYRKLNISIPIYEAQSPNAKSGINYVAQNKDNISSSNTNSQTASGYTSSLEKTPQAKNEYGTNSKHGKIVKSTSEKQGTIVVKKEWYEDGYYSIFLMDKCKACGGTGKVGYGFCTGCAMGIQTLLTYYDPSGNEVERSGTVGGLNNPSYGGGSSSYSGSNSSRSSGNSNSVYTKCTSCNGTGRCTSCNGRGYKFNSYAGHDDTCPNCRGKGSCPICYGRGKL